MYKMSGRVRYSEVDQTKAITLPSIIDYFQDCSTFQSEDLGLGFEFLESSKKGWVLSSWQLILKRAPLLGEKIEIQTFATGFDGLYGTRNFKMLDERGKQVAYANSIWVFMDLHKGRPTKPKPEDIDAYGIWPAIEMEYAQRKITLPKESVRLEEIPIYKSHIDTNNHVNNCQYIQMALEVLDSKVKIRQLRVEYKRSAVYGDVILPKLAIEEDRTVVLLCDLKETPYAIVEFRGDK